MPRDTLAQKCIKILRVWTSESQLTLLKTGKVTLGAGIAQSV
jgi:hypothetical protein